MKYQPTSPTELNSPAGKNPNEHAVRAGLAAATLVMGIVGLIACPIVGMAAVVTGIIAIVREKRNPARYGGRGMAIAGLVCGGVGAFVVGPFLFTILMSSLSRAAELSKRVRCASNLQDVGIALRIYRYDFPDQGLPTLERLVELDLVAADRIHCPSAASSTPHYILVDVPSEFEDETLVAYEPKSNHQGDGGHLLYDSGRTLFLMGPKYDPGLRKAGLSRIP